MRHLYTGPHVDVQKTMDDAHKKSLGDNHNTPENVLVHDHAHSTHCEGKSHAFYKAGEGRLEGAPAHDAIVKAIASKYKLMRA